MIDIIIPVFNAYRHARACVDSVLAHTAASDASILLIDDASTDPRIAAWLTLLAEQQPHIKILRNPVNLGFVQTVNRGMRESVNDVVLLNSDTLVTPGWLNKLTACAGSRDDVATVTPFSNNAEICSYPVFCRNTRVQGLDTQGLVHALESAFDGTYPEIPTAVGFSMFIRRRALDEVGLFDAERFGKGYGEENDFCWRARKAGWVHLLCPDAWVSHLGGQSFAEQTDTLKQQNLERLLEVHPEYQDRIAEFVARDPIAPYRQRIFDTLARRGLDELGRPQRPGVLLVTHAMGGGIEKHVSDLQQLLDKQVRVEVLKPYTEHAFHLSDSLGNECLIGAESAVFSQAIAARGYSRIHIHHLHGYPRPCAEALLSLGIPFDITVHDFAYWCPQYNLSLPNGLYCGEKGPQQCAQCLADRPHAWQVSIDEWRELQHRWLLAADRVIAPSEFIANRIRQSWPDVEVLGWPHPPRHEWLHQPERRVHVGVIGGLSVGKGLDSLVACASYAAVRELPVEFTVIGYTARAIPTWPDLPIRITGEYADTELPFLLQSLRLDCLWLASVIPESYSYTLDAALLTNLSIFASKRSGAVASRLTSSSSRFRLVDEPLDVCALVSAFMQVLQSTRDAALSVTSSLQSRTALREAYLKNLLQPISTQYSASESNMTAPALPVMPQSSNSASAAPSKLPLSVLLEHGVDCGHRQSKTALRQRVLDMERQHQALLELEAREGRRWYEHLDALHTERAGLYAERDRLAAELDARKTEALKLEFHNQRLLQHASGSEHEALRQLELREGKPWYEYLDDLHAERARLYDERGSLLFEVDALRDHVSQWNRNDGIPRWRWRWHATRATVSFLKISTSIKSGLSQRLRSLRQPVKRIFRGIRRWPIALDVLRHEGVGALWRRVHRQIFPPQSSAYQKIQVVPPVSSLTIGPLELKTARSEETPRVSIIIPVYGQHAYTFQCLQSLAVHTDLSRVEIIVIDDASPQAAQAAMGQVTGVKWMVNAENMGFLLTCNRAAEVAQGEFLVLLNNDIQVTKDWLPALLEVFNSRADAGLVGAQLLYPDGRLQEAGGVVWKDGSAWNWGRLQNPACPEYQYLRPVDYCSGACLAIRAAIWREVGGFDTAYVPAYYEDTDLAFRIRSQGLQVYYQASCRVIHHEGVTSGTDDTQGVKRHQVINSERFFQRWKATLAHHAPNGVEPWRAANRWARKHMLIVEACMITPDQDSGSVRMLAMLRVLVSLRVHVTFIAENLEHREPYVSQLQAEGVEVWFAPHVNSVSHLLRERGSTFDVVMLCRHYIAAPLLDAVRQHAPQAQVWFDTVDLHFLREERLAALQKSAAIARTASQTRAQETAVINGCDLTIVVSPVEQSVLAEHVPAARVEVLSNIHDVKHESPGFASRHGLLFVGGFQHPPNVDAVQWFVNEVWPLVRAKSPDMVVRIVGSKMPDKLRALGGGGVEMLGFVEDIEPLLRSSRVSIAPLRYGAGVKGKVNQAMAHGLPVVATPAAVEGMGLTIGEHVLVGETPQSFADAVLCLCADESMWTKLAAGGRRNVAELFSSQRASQTLQRLLGFTEMTA